MRLRPDVGDPEGGFTLTEVLAALVILGVAIVAIISSMGTSIIVTDMHQKSVTSDAVVRTFAERLRAANYIECASLADAGYKAVGAGSLNIPKPAKVNASIVSIQYWNGDNPATFSSTCPINPDNGLQKITIKAVSSDNRGGASLQILKRRP